MQRLRHPTPKEWLAASQTTGLPAPYAVTLFCRIQRFAGGLIVPGPRAISNTLRVILFAS